MAVRRGHRLLFAGARRAKEPRRSGSARTCSRSLRITVKAVGIARRARGQAPALVTIFGYPKISRRRGDGKR